MQRLSKFVVSCEEGGIRFVYSGLSGAVLQLECSTYDALVRDPTGVCARDPALGDLLKKWYVVIDDRIDELKILRRRYTLGRDERSHLGLTVITSLGCNFDCPYCYEDKRKTVMSAGTEAALVELVANRLASLKSLNIHWLGGEPLLAKRQLLRLSRDLSGACKAQGVRYSANVTTNGYLLTRKTASELAEVGITHAQVCLDGPQPVHDRMRPQANGKGSFDRILSNICEVHDVLDLTVRVNADASNFAELGELLEVLSREGLAGKITIYLGQLVKVNDGAQQPSATYIPRCFSGPEFAGKEIEFLSLAARLGFNGPALPGPITTPCTAVRPDEFVMGSEGELYKCWENVGNRNEIVGHISDLSPVQKASAKWLGFDPTIDEECSGCIALPNCMGGCRHHQLDPDLYESRCSTFRHTHAEQLSLFARQSLGNLPTAQIHRLEPVTM